MTTLLQDLRYALRMLLKFPAFTAVVIVTLALGIGANTALFSVVNGVLLNPLPYPHSTQLVAVYEKNVGMDRAPISYLNFLDWQRATQTFSSLALYRHEDYNLTGRGQAERVNGLMVSASFFPTLGIHPALGRDFRSEDDRIGAAPVVMLSDGFWHSHFGASPNIVGSSIDLNGTDYTVMGILPPEFSFYGIQRDIYTPVGQWNDPSFLDRRVDVSSHALGRLKPGVTLAQARADMDSIAHHLALAYPEADKGVGIGLLSMKEDMVGNVQPFLLVLLAAVAFLLLISCANVASLLLARSMSRSGEFALRASLGASRIRIIRQLLTESLLLAGLGGTLGFLLAFFGTKAVIRLLPGALPRASEVSIDARVLLFTLGVSLLGGIIFGLAPALRSSRANLQQVLRQSSRGAGDARHRLQGLFVAVEVAMAFVLLIGAGLMLRSLAALWRVNPGYNPEHAITFSLSLPSNSRTTPAETRARLRRFDADMRAIPGVEAVSVTLGSRPMIHDSELPFWIEGQPKPANFNDMHQACSIWWNPDSSRPWASPWNAVASSPSRTTRTPPPWSTLTTFSHAATSPTRTPSVNTSILPDLMWKRRSSVSSDTFGSGVRATTRKTPLKRSSTTRSCSFLRSSCGWSPTESPSFCAPMKILTRSWDWCAVTSRSSIREPSFMPSKP